MKKYCVSVPFRGFCFSTLKSTPFFINLGTEFPSPFGDFVFQLNMALLYCNWIKMVSVPFRGFCFSTSRVKLSSIFLEIRFPSPFGDFVFQLVWSVV